MIQQLTHDINQRLATISTAFRTGQTQMATSLESQVRQQTQAYIEQHPVLPNLRQVVARIDTLTKTLDDMEVTLIEMSFKLVIHLFL